METLIATALSFKKGVGGATVLKLLKKYGSLQEGVKEEKVELSKELKLAEKELKSAERKGIKVIPISSKDYPPLLKEIAQPPVVLYVKGKGKLPEFGVAVVGSRKCSSYGKRIAFKLGKFLGENGIPVVSGLALGIDSKAHEGTVEGKGTGIAVLGSGVDQLYPRSNKYLVEKLLEEGGFVVSEFSIGTRPKKENFPRRNRIISGLSLAVVVVEAGEKSGTFVTVSYALEQGRTVFAVPGNVDSPFSVGTNKLIKEGATPLTSFEDIFEEIPYLKTLAKKEKADIPKKYKKLLELLSSPKTIDQICFSLKEELPTVTSLLLELEMKGLIKREGAVYYTC